MKMKIVSTIVITAAFAVLPPLVHADDTATAPDASAATSMDFSNFVGLQVPEGLQIGADSDASVQGVAGSSADGLLTFQQFPNGPRLIQLEGSTVIYWVDGNNIKIPMLTRAVFLSYGNKDEDVQTVAQDEFDFYQNAKYIRLDGKGGIYFTSGNNKRFIPSSVWSDTGADASQVISVNKTDFNSYKTGKAITSVEELN